MDSGEDSLLAKMASSSQVHRMERNKAHKVGRYTNYPRLRTAKAHQTGCNTRQLRTHLSRGESAVQLTPQQLKKHLEFLEKHRLLKQFKAINVSLDFV